MRKLLPVLLLTALLPGCVLAIGNSPNDDKSRTRIRQLEERIAQLEQQLDAQGGGQTYVVEEVKH